MEHMWDELATEIAEDFASDYLSKEYGLMSDNDLSKLRDDLKKKIDKESIRKKDKGESSRKNGRILYKIIIIFFRKASRKTF